MNLYEKIKYLCDKQELAISRLEQKLGLGNGTIRRWSKTYPSADKVENVANYFRVSVDYLLDRGDVYDMGHAIKEERTEQGLSLKELADALGITEEELQDYENDIIPLSHFRLNMMCHTLGIDVIDFLEKYDLYEGYIPPHFEGDLKKFLSFQKAIDEDVLKESSNTIFTTAQEAMKFILEQPALMAFGGYDLNKMSEDEIIDFANELLRQFELISYKYKK